MRVSELERHLHVQEPVLQFGSFELAAPRLPRRRCNPLIDKILGDEATSNYADRTLGEDPYACNTDCNRVSNIPLLVAG
jgi:hypothetical protein